MREDKYAFNFTEADKYLLMMILDLWYLSGSTRIKMYCTRSAQDFRGTQT